jgi:hypothetical protein
MMRKRKSPQIMQFIKEFFQEEDSGVHAIKILKIVGVILLVCIAAPFIGIFNAFKYILEKALNVLNDIWKHVYKLLIVIISILVVLFIFAVIADRLGCPWIFDLVSKIVLK